jgi:hypothetical protein
MGNRWSTSVALSSPSKPLTRAPLKAQDICPVCLEQCSAGPQEFCENGHSMHRECARKMSLHMTLQCPLCRSKLVCSDCRSGKSSIVCYCANISSKPGRVWETVQQICKTHLCLSVAIFLLPFNPAALIVGILLNCSMMLRRIAECLRRSDEIKNWSMTHQAAIKITQIGMDLMTICLVFVAASAWSL